VFRTLLLSIIRSSSMYTQQWYRSYRFVDIFQAGPGWNCNSILVLLEIYLQTCMTYTIAECTWMNSWWWTEEVSETCSVSWQNKLVKLVHLVGFITKKFIMMHGHMSRCTVTCHDARSHARNILKTYAETFLSFLKQFALQMRYTSLDCIHFA